MDNQQRHYAPGMRVVIKDEEWVIRRADDSADGSYLLTCKGISELVRGREKRFLTQLEEQISILGPASTLLVEDASPNYQTFRIMPLAFGRLTGGQHLLTGTVSKTFDDDHQLGDPAKHTIVYQAPLRQTRPRAGLPDCLGFFSNN